MLSTSQAALVVGLAFITSVVIVSVVDDLLLANFVIPGDIEALSRDIETNRKRFGFAVSGYLLVLSLDAIIGIALYVVLKPANRKLALYTAALRLLYVVLLTIGVLALAAGISDVHGYATIRYLGYISFALHVFLLGYSSFRSGYIPKSLGILLIIASFTYVVFFADLHLPEILQVTTMSIMALAELSLSIWLIARRNKLPTNSS